MSEKEKTKKEKTLSIPVRFINPDKQYECLQTQSVRKKGSYAYYIPLLNSLYDEFLDEPTISSDRINDLITATTLLSGLFLGAVCAIPMSVDFEEVGKARERFKAPPYNKTPYANDVIITDLAAYTSASVYSLGSSMISIVVFYLLSGIKTANGEDTPLKIRVSWWRFNRFVILFIVLSTISGMVFSFFAFNRFAFIKFPDLWVENGGKMINGTWSNEGRNVDIPSVRTSTYGALLSWAYFYAIGSFVANWMVMSCARIRQNIVEKKVYKDYNEYLIKWNEEHNIMLAHLHCIVKAWDMADGLCDSANPFLLDLGTGAMEKHEKKKSNATKVDPNKTTFVWHTRDHTSENDCRVNKAFEVIQAANYTNWSIFLRDYKRSPEEFRSLSARWRITLSLIANLKEEIGPGECKEFLTGEFKLLDTKAQEMDKAQEKYGYLKHGDFEWKKQPQFDSEGKKVPLSEIEWKKEPLNVWRILGALCPDDIPTR